MRGSGREGAEEPLSARAEDALAKTARGFGQMIPIMLGVILLISLASALAPEGFHSYFFTGNVLLDSVAGASAGSVAVGNPITSYIIAGELLARGVSLVAVTAFILAWVTVGVVQFQAESMILGRRFAVKRNVVSFFTSIVIACLVVLTLGVAG
jgi:uncharacterized membrane protein YraQ (UPF0718 family)